MSEEVKNRMELNDEALGEVNGGSSWELDTAFFTKAEGEEAPKMKTTGYRKGSVGKSKKLGQLGDMSGMGSGTTGTLRNDGFDPNKIMQC